jgi:hypothetical protein
MSVKLWIEDLEAYGHIFGQSLVLILPIFALPKSLWAILEENFCYGLEMFLCHGITLLLWLWRGR